MANKKSWPAGSMLIEAASALALLTAFTSISVLSAYLIFARAWILYQSEQALYCRAVGPGFMSPHCLDQLEQNLRRFLPYGELSSRLETWGSGWRVEVQWNFQNHSFVVVKNLSPSLILRRKDLP